MTAINDITRERHLALLVHEVTHIPVGRGSTEQHGSHPPRFWKGMAYNAALVYDSLQDGRLAAVFPDADPKDFVREVVKDPNEQTVDQRYWPVNECKDEVHNILVYCIHYEHSIEYLPESSY